MMILCNGLFSFINPYLLREPCKLDFFFKKREKGKEKKEKTLTS